MYCIAPKDSVRAFKERAKLLQNQDDINKREEEKRKLHLLETESLLKINIGDRSIFII